ncbi:ATP-dependent DNA ligase [Parapedobacter pyrenivorans]|uniref:DNA ligase (ATP) n=1 Tax=Parapedobacter pyrenivorans TaxID=1305674 RepID=A0A917HYF7_9SPHI|nr:ATP-dependent DNA ligase [Parapedobacter pyrenivorans]GGG97752.1 ATP-dependent DNA ligase [Parapedobacter pyrenivorans]
MKRFTDLFTAIDQTTKTNEKVAAIVRFLADSDDRSKLYAIALLIGNRPRRPVKTSDLKKWATEIAKIPDWLFEESYHIVGDLAEAIALVLPFDSISPNDYRLPDVIDELSKLSEQSDARKKDIITDYWRHLGKDERFIFTKLITGNFRIGVSRQLVIKALSIHLNMDEAAVAHRLMGKWIPAAETMMSLFSEPASGTRDFQPYPFYLAYQLDTPPESLGDIEDWYIEKKLDGIRGQIIVRNGQLFVWSRGEDLLTDKFPEFTQLAESLPDGTVIDGEIIPWQDGQPLPFQVMQTRIGRKNLSQKSLREAPLVMVCYDLLEWNGEDIRDMPMSYRRNLLETLLSSPTAAPDVLLLSEIMPFNNWPEVAVFRQHARDFHCEGVMLKRRDSSYGSGRRRGNWWKWKTDPLTADGVLIYAQSGHGRRANLYTDYTFAVWDETGTLVPFAKAYSGLTDKEITELDAWIKRNTTERFGPVRSVKPHHVFEIAFEGIQKSSRHKSGVALRFPRILRWRRDKSPESANTQTDLLELIAAVNG